MMLFPGAKPFEPFRERLESSEGGNTGRRAIRPCHAAFQENRTAVRSAPGRDRAEAGFIGCPSENASFAAVCGRTARRSAGLRFRAAGGDTLQKFGKLHRQRDPLADLPRARESTSPPRIRLSFSSRNSRFPATNWCRNVGIEARARQVRVRDQGDRCSSANRFCSRLERPPWPKQGLFPRLGSRVSDSLRLGLDRQVTGALTGGRSQCLTAAFIRAMKCRLHSCFQGRAARRSAWARGSPRPFAVARGRSSMRSTPRSATSSARSCGRGRPRR